MDENHGRVIIHLDIDCFYAQVEMNKAPELREKPLGVKQKNIVVTCNYPARARGVVKCSYIDQAMEVCPELELVNGEDLADYRRVSAAVFSTLSETGCPVERLGMDENWLDVTQIVRLRQMEQKETPKVRGHLFGSLSCQECDCVEALTIGTIIAQELRDQLKERHQLTCSAGIAHNKLLAKLVGGRNKPNDQTVVAADGVSELLGTLKAVRNLPGIGRRTAELLGSIGIESLDQLRAATTDQIVAATVPKSQAETIRELAWGRDSSEVKFSGRCASIGLEDRFMGLYDKAGSRDKLSWLLGRLVQLLAEDGRRPTSIKVTVRDYYKDKFVKKFSKESRQCRISPRLFQLNEGKLSPESETEILDSCEALLCKMVDFSDSVHITLLGLAVTDFQELVNKKSSIKNFFISPKKEGLPVSVPTSAAAAQHKKSSKRLWSGQDVENAAASSTSASENHSQELNLFEEKRIKCMDQDVKKPESQSCSNSSPDKDLNANVCLTTDGSSATISTASTSSVAKCPSHYDPEVWDALPEELQWEILHENAAHTSESSSARPPGSSSLPEGFAAVRSGSGTPGKKSTPRGRTPGKSRGKQKSGEEKKNTILKYFSKN